ncbi:UNVERIFIED_CONTAM: hypothetical protein NCL1_23406 [Trichonephila clavipes]
MKNSSSETLQSELDKNPPEEPTITCYDDNFELKEGDHQSFTCSSLAGNPPAELRWYRGDAEFAVEIDAICQQHNSSSGVANPNDLAGDIGKKV